MLCSVESAYRRKWRFRAGSVGLFCGDASMHGHTFDTPLCDWCVPEDVILLVRKSILRAHEVGVVVLCTVKVVCTFLKTGPPSINMLDTVK